MFNDTLQIDDTGKVITRDEQTYILLDDTSLPVLAGVTSMLIRSFFNFLIRTSIIRVQPGQFLFYGQFAWKCYYGCSQSSITVNVLLTIHNRNMNKILRALQI